MNIYKWTTLLVPIRNYLCFTSFNYVFDQKETELLWLTELDTENNTDWWLGAKVSVDYTVF